MDDKITKVPAIRFKGFTDPWEQRKLGDEAEILAGGDIDKERIQKSGKYPVLANALTNDGIVGYYDDSYRVEAPAVTVTGRGDVGYGQARKTSFTPVVRLLAVKSDHDVDFLEAAINNHSVLVESTGVPQLTSPQLGNYKINFPALEEEKKIGKFLVSINTTITLHQRELDLMKQEKQTLLSKMFPKNGEKFPELRFEGFTDPWEQRKLSDVSTYRGGTSIEKYFDDNGIYKVISIGSYGLDSKYVDQGIRAVSNEVTDSRLVKSGELTMVLNDKTANGMIIGRSLLIEENDEFVINQRTGIITPKKELDSLFAYFVLNGGFREQVRKIVQGGTQIYVNYSAVENLKVILPTIEEQQKIGEFFRTLDTTITLHQQELDLMKNIKKALLKAMFV